MTFITELLRPSPCLQAGGSSMAYVIAEPRIGTKDTACVDACPWTAFTSERISRSLETPNSYISIRSSTLIAGRVSSLAQCRRSLHSMICRKSGRALQRSMSRITSVEEPEVPSGSAGEIRACKHYQLDSDGVRQVQAGQKHLVGKMEIAKTQGAVVRSIRPFSTMNWPRQDSPLSSF